MRAVTAGRRRAVVGLHALLLTAPMLAQGPPPALAGGPWVVGLASVGSENGGGTGLAGRAELEAAFGARLRIRVGAEGWLGTGDCLTTPVPSTRCESPSGWALATRLAIGQFSGRLAPFFASGLGVAFSDGTRLLADVGAGVDVVGSRRIALRVEAGYRRLFGLARPDRASLAAGLRVALGREVDR